jgi:hypothetical protein
MMLGENDGLKGHASRAGEPVAALDRAALTKRIAAMPVRAGCVRRQRGVMSTLHPVTFLTGRKSVFSNGDRQNSGTIGFSFETPWCPTHHRPQFSSRSSSTLIIRFITGSGQVLRCFSCTCCPRRRAGFIFGPGAKAYPSPKVGGEELSINCKGRLGRPSRSRAKDRTRTSNSARTCTRLPSF